MVRFEDKVPLFQNGDVDIRSISPVGTTTIDKTGSKFSTSSRIASRQKYHHTP